MNVRGKLFAAMAALVILVVGVYFGTTQGYLSGLFHDYSDQRTAQTLLDYYAVHGSWEGVGERELQEGSAPRRPDAGGLTLISVDGKELLHAGQFSSDIVRVKGSQLPLRLNGTLIGQVYIYRWETAEMIGLRSYVVSSMLKEGFRVAALATLAGLLAGIWLTRRLTKPLRNLIPAIDRITAGDMDTRLTSVTRDEYGKVAEALNSMADRLRQAEEMRKQLTADVAHELRTPLTSVQCQLENIQMEGLSVPPEDLLPLQDDLLRLSTMVNDLHLLSSAEAGVLSLDRQFVDLCELVQSLADTVKFEAVERHIHLERSLNEKPVIVNIDANRIRQAIYNVLINALRYTPSGGTVVLKVEGAEMNTDCPGYAFVTITDTGIGIAEDQLPYLFERFYRVQSSRSRHDGGMGLGLAIAKEFIELHGGFMRVHSKVGEGSAFILNLPVEVSKS